MIHNNIVVFTKIEMAQKLSDRGIFVDIATLESFLKKWNIEAIFENEKGEDLYDKNSFETLYENIKNKSAKTQEIKEEKQEAKQEELKSVEENLNEIKWHAWQEVSGDLCKMRPGKSTTEGPLEVPPITPLSAISNIAEEILPKTVTEEPREKEVGTVSIPPAPLTDPQLQTLLTNGLRNDNVFKLDISEDTLDMIARSIAKKVVKHVNTGLSQMPEINNKMFLIEAQNEDLQKELDRTKEENLKLQEELEDKRENLGRFKKSIFGFYRFVRAGRKEKEKNK